MTASIKFVIFYTEENVPRNEIIPENTEILQLEFSVFNKNWLYTGFYEPSFQDGN